MVSARAGLAYVLVVALLASGTYASAYSVSPHSHVPGNSSGLPGVIAPPSNFVKNPPSSTVNSSPYIYTNVTFNERGLPTGAIWSVNVSGAIYRSNASSIHFHLASGSYSYNASSSLGFFSPGMTGHFSVHSTPIVLSMDFLGKYSFNSYLNLATGKLVNSTLFPEGTGSVFPVFATYDNYSQVYLVAGFHNSIIYEVSAENFTVLKNISSPGVPVALSYNSLNGDVYVLNSTSLFVLSPSGVIKGSANLGKSLLAVGYDPANDQIMVGGTGGMVISVDASSLNPVSYIKGVTVVNSQGFSYNGKTGDMEVINDSSSTGSILAIGANDSVVSEVSTPALPLSVVYDPQNGKTYFTVASTSQSSLFVMNGSAIDEIPGVPYAFGLAIDSFDGTIITSNVQNGIVSVINATTENLVYSIMCKGIPLLPVTAPGTGNVLIVNPSEDALNILSASEEVNSVVFRESGLAAGTFWSVSVNGTAISSSNDSLTFFEIPGTYQYSVNQQFGYTVQSGGTVDIGSTGALVNITFHTAYAVKFTEMGLTAGSVWSVRLGTEAWQGFEGQNASFLEPNGTYEFMINSSSSFIPSPDSGFITINGHSVNVTLHFSPVVYNLTFFSQGLPSGTQWNVSINGITESTSNPEISYPTAVGTYNYSISAVPGFYPSIRNATIEVTNSNVTVTVTWLPDVYRVDFTEHGLPLGTVWSISIGSQYVYSTIDHNLTLSLPDGNYAYDVRSSSSSWVGTSGTFAVNSANISVNISFRPVTYVVVFTSPDIEQDMSWNLNVSGIGSANVTNNSKTLYLINGTYDFSAVSSNSSYNSINGTFTVNGRNLSLYLNFTVRLYAVHFEEVGLSGNVTWGVNISGKGIFQTSNTSFSLILPEGSYLYSVLQVKGYSSEGTGNFTINSASDNVFVNFTRLAGSQELYNMTIIENGLPKGLNWGISINSTLYAANEGGILLKLENGTYSLSIFAMSHTNGKILPGGMNFSLVVDGHSSKAVVIFLGSYVFIVLDFPLLNNTLHHFHGERNHGSKTKDDGHHSFDEERWTYARAQSVKHALKDEP